MKAAARTLVLALVALSPRIAAADEPLLLRYTAPPYLVATSFGFGIEPTTRATAKCSQLMKPAGGGAAVDTPVPQCNLLLVFGVQAEALWRGVVGAAIELYASEGTPVSPDQSGSTAQPGFGDRISTVLAATARPLGFLAWTRAGWGYRLLAGLGVQAGISIEYARTSLDSTTNVGLHLSALWDVPLWRSNSEGGLSLRLAARFLISQDAVFPVENNKIVEPGTAAQLWAGIAYYL